MYLNHAIEVVITNGKYNKPATAVQYEEIHDENKKKKIPVS